MSMRSTLPAKPQVASKPIKPKMWSPCIWVDFDFFGHQISLHLGTPFQTHATGLVGDIKVPMPHFGIITLVPEWQLLAQRLEEKGVEFVIKPHLRFAGQPGEQWTMFFLDPFGNPIEVKGFESFDKIY